jgi:integrase
MASICDDPGGRKRVLFNGQDGLRRPIRLGKMSRKQADSFKIRLENLIADRNAGHAPSVELAAWIRGLDSVIRRRLVAAGLLSDDGLANVKLGGLLDHFFAGLVVKSSTVVVYRQASRNLLEFFTKDRLVRKIRPLDADKWRQYLVQCELAQPTISKRVKTARQIFKRALKWKMITENPFEDVKAGSQTNKSRMYFISRKDADKVLAACPDAQWRLIFVLSRFGGVRCPSETLALKWSDVDWERSRLRIPSEKTEHLEGHDCRWIPMFPELRPHLMEVFDKAEEGTEYVITRYRVQNENLRTQFQRIVCNAGLTPWAKPFHNLRSTRETELAEIYPIHVVCAWLGNSRAVAQDHYLQVTESHFARAIREAAQNPAQQGAESARKDSRSSNPQKQNRPVLPSDSASCDSVQDFDMTPTGFEPVSRP